MQCSATHSTSSDDNSGFLEKIRKKIRIRTECVQMCVLRCLKFPVFISSHSLAFSLFQLFFDASSHSRAADRRRRARRKNENGKTFSSSSSFSFRKDENLYSPHQFTVAVCTMCAIFGSVQFYGKWEWLEEEKKTLLTSHGGHSREWEVSKRNYFWIFIDRRRRSASVAFPLFLLFSIENFLQLKIYDQNRSSWMWN